MGRKLKVARLRVTMCNETGNLYVVNYASPLKVWMSNKYITLCTTTLKFNKNYTVIGEFL